MSKTEGQRAKLVVTTPTEEVNTAGLPDEFQHAERIGGLPSTVKFENPDEWYAGEYSRFRSGVGKNKKRLYELQNESGELVGVWGSTSLDAKFDQAYPPIQAGDRLCIVFRGTKETARKQNPVKVFDLFIVRASA